MGTLTVGWSSSLLLWSVQPTLDPLASKTTSPDASHDKTLVLRPDIPPVSQLDFDDRHDTRATESEEMAQRYADLRKDRRRNDWHYLAMGLVRQPPIAG
jgi:hypothetical protein